MGKPIRVNLLKNQSVATEVQYTVTLLVSFDDKRENQTRLFTKTVRANSDEEALGVVAMVFRRDKDWKHYVIASFAMTKTGD